MINYKKYILNNGLTILANRDCTSKLVAVNLLYKVGARDENPERTGFAHLFEHLMFKGSKNIPNFDLPVQMACGENNAFTNNDYTDFYITLPKDNIETALWLESDRMMGLNITEENLSSEKRVVIEEFKQRYLNQPYGDQTTLLRDMTFKEHPYRWSTIGRTPEHIENATLEEVTEFYNRYYRPSNAILSVSGDIEETEVLALAQKWFAHIEDDGIEPIAIPQEPVQTESRRLCVERDVPSTTISIAFHIGARQSRNFFIGDLISDLLASGDSSRLYNNLVKQQGLFASVNAYVSGDIDPGLFVFTGQLLPTTTEEQAEAAIWSEIENLKLTQADSYEVAKVKNKFEASTLFGEINVMNKAMNLGFYEMLGDLPLINEEVAKYQSITTEEIALFSKEVFTPENSSTLIYRAKQK